ncbi:VOC family protein [Haloterrigena salinisoli]|uniref:VOC family protein n=1 Tax=Haloterrigena salinisoli TaxID=3132747 RepID=UPI0030D5A383
MRISATHHVGVVVTDLDAALEFYGETLGLEVVDEFTLAGEGIATAIDVDGATGHFAHLTAGTDGTRIELIEYEPAGADAHPTAINQHGAIHIGFAVADLQAFYEALPADADPLSKPQQVELGLEILFFRDPDGNVIEVVETEG